MGEWTTRLEGDLHLALHAGPGGVSVWTFGRADDPLVFVQHGLGSRKERHLPLALRLVQAGFRVAMADAPSHGERRDERSAALQNGNDPGFLPAAVAVIVQAAREIGQIADWLGGGPFAIVGHSMGGLIALRVGLTDPRAAIVVSVGAPLGPDALPDAHRLPEPIRSALQREDPIARAAQLWPRPVLLLHGAQDPVTPPSGTRALFEALAPHYAADPARLSWIEQLDTGHELTPEMADAILAFLGAHFGGR